MDELLKTLILGAPNFVIALYALWRLFNVLETLVTAITEILKGTLQDLGTIARPDDVS